MTVSEAREYKAKFDEIEVPTEDDIFLFTEAMRYLIEEEKDPKDMMWLGGYYYEQRDFDLALKYYEMARAYDYGEAYKCLGYIWYYGRTGEKDYKKAYECFSRLMEKGDPVASYKIADMYKNGYYVEQDYHKFAEIVEELYDNKVTGFRSLGDPFPEISVRLAEIRRKQGKIEDAVNILLIAKEFLARRIGCWQQPFFGDLNIMRGLVNDLYDMAEFVEDEFDLYDLYYLLKYPHVVKFDLGDKQYIIESVQEDGMCAVRFEGKWYKDVGDFFEKAMVDGKRISRHYKDCYGWECLPD